MRSMPNVVVFVLSLVLPALATGQAFPQTPPKSTTEAPAAAADPLGRDTPRGTVLGFIKAVDSENYERAAQYLDTRAAPKAARELARQLKDVLDRRLSATDFDLLSAKPEGRLDSDLPPNVERVLRGETRRTSSWSASLATTGSSGSSLLGRSPTCPPCTASWASCTSSG